MEQSQQHKCPLQSKNSNIINNSFSSNETQVYNSTKINKYKQLKYSVVQKIVILAVLTIDLKSSMVMLKQV